MNIKICLFVLLLLCVGYVNVVDNPLSGKTIYIDPGHGGIDPGATYKDIYEENINLGFSFVLKEAFEKKGASVLMTRVGDYDLASTTYYRKRSDLSNRALMINNSSCDLYLSIHLNSSVYSSWNGAQVFYDDNNPFNKVLASLIQSNLGKKEIVNKNNYYMYSRVEKAGVLIELGFISNSDDRNNLLNKNYMKQVAAKIVDAVVKFNEIN